MRELEADSVHFGHRDLADSGADSAEPEAAGIVGSRVGSVVETFAADSVAEKLVDSAARFAADFAELLVAGFAVLLAVDFVGSLAVDSVE